MADSAKANPNQQDAVEDLKSNARDYQEKVGNVVNRVKDNLAHTKDVTRQRAHEVYEKAHDAYEKVADTSLHDVQHSLEDFTRRRPLTTLAVAAGVGLVVGLLIRGHK